MADEDNVDPTGAAQAITAMTFDASLEDQCAMILDLIAAAPDDENVLGDIAAGPLEGFLSNFDAAVIDRGEAEAASEPRFRRVVSGVWKLEMSDPVWQRIRAIQATVPDPLPAMRPFGTGERRQHDDDRS
jgi:hypothetical protein